MEISRKADRYTQQWLLVATRTPSPGLCRMTLLHDNGMEPEVDAKRLEASKDRGTGLLFAYYAYAPFLGRRGEETRALTYVPETVRPQN